MTIEYECFATLADYQKRPKQGLNRVSMPRVDF